jgi:alginate O-acetyltransferase complex protein AlgI
MLFNTPQFAVFLALVLALHYGLPRRFRASVLLGASLLFYSVWVPVYLLLLAAEIGVNYALLRGMLRSHRPRLFLIASCVFTLGLLAWFKYAAMIVQSVLPVFGGTGWGFTAPEIFLPLGISFYSFQILSLTIDAYRGNLDEAPPLRRYALFVCFFPQLIAGPIVRGFQFLPQLERGGEPTLDRTRRGLWLIAVGLAKKVIVADFLLSPFVDMVFAPDAPSISSFHLIAMYSFAFQIYFDFSGYTNIARGLALLFGFELPTNFLEPYLSRDPSEFWRRWHITLSRWLSDYLYIPLGGNRAGTSRTYLNLMVTMLLGGLWHGASWNFVIWGGLHGLLLVGHRLIRRTGQDPERRLSALDIPKIFVLFNITCLIWVFFRAQTFELALDFYSVLFHWDSEAGWPYAQVLIVMLCGGLHFVERSLRLKLPGLRQRLGSARFGSLFEGALFGALLGVAIMVSGAGGEFIYFQF